MYTESYEKANKEQKNILDTLKNVSDNPDDKRKIFFIDAPGGTGKTFVLNAFIAYERSNDKICVPVATQGIAAILMKGGKTAHTTFGVPLNSDSQSTSYIKKNTALGKMLQKAHSIVFDEAPMCNKDIIDLINK
jgi:hypothetical protein